MSQNILSATSVYAFVGWVSSILSFVLFLTWAYLPEKYLNSLGITYYPSKYYAVALPAYLLVVYALSGIIFISINLINTPYPDEINTIRDKYTRQAARIHTTDGIPDIGDMDLQQVSQLLVPNIR